MTPSELDGYRPVSPAEAIKWQVDHDKCDIFVMEDGVLFDQHFARDDGGFHSRPAGDTLKAWTMLHCPANPEATYYIPEVWPKITEVGGFSFVPVTMDPNRPPGTGVILNKGEAIVLKFKEED